MLFMSANDAVSFKDEVFGTQNLSKPKIGTLFMDKVFRLHMQVGGSTKSAGMQASMHIRDPHSDVSSFSFLFQARPKELENVALRLMPDRKQVQHAFSSCKETGSPISVLPGVPVFQAEGLTMRSGNKTFVPLFFGKEELDFALEQAFGKNLVTPAVAYKREWMDRQKQRIKEVAKSPFPFLYHNIWAKDDEKAKARIKVSRCATHTHTKARSLSGVQPNCPAGAASHSLDWIQAFWAANRPTEVRPTLW